VNGFGIDHLPYGVFSVAGGPRRVGVRYDDEDGSWLLDVHAETGQPEFAQPSLNPLMALGPEVWRQTRDEVRGLIEGGAELVRVAATQDPETGALTVGAEDNLSALCGLPATADVRRPTVSWDGKRIAFSARTSASEPLGIYVVDGASCEREPAIAAAAVDENGEALPDNGELVHDFDPAFAADAIAGLLGSAGLAWRGTSLDLREVAA
jgi:fumarylacetoacetase